MDSKIYAIPHEIMCGNMKLKLSCLKNSDFVIIEIFAGTGTELFDLIAECLAHFVYDREIQVRKNSKFTFYLIVSML